MKEGRGDTVCGLSALLACDVEWPHPTSSTPHLSANVKRLAALPAFRGPDRSAAVTDDRIPFTF